MHRLAPARQLAERFLRVAWHEHLATTVRWFAKGRLARRVFRARRKAIGRASVTAETTLAFIALAVTWCRIARRKLRFTPRSKTGAAIAGKTTLAVLRRATCISVRETTAIAAPCAKATATGSRTTVARETIIATTVVAVAEVATGT